MIIDRKLKITFGKVSELYHASRVSYPKELVKDVIDLSGIGKSAKILYVGCGSGQASILFAKRGYNITGIEISKDMIAIAKEVCHNYSNAKFQIRDFEKASFPKESFNLIISGQAWHWVDPKIADKKAHRLLENNGRLAVFWSLQENKKSLFLQKVSKILDKYHPKSTMHFSEIAEKKLSSSELFDKPTKKVYYARPGFNREKYLKLVLTYSWVQKLSGAESENLTKELKSLLKHEPPNVNIPYKYVLLIARKRAKVPRKN